MESSQDRSGYPRFLERLCELKRTDAPQRRAAHLAGALSTDQEIGKADKSSMKCMGGSD
jgi:hypothetical protein